MVTFELGREDFPHDLCWLYDIVGGECLTQIVDMAGGEIVYIPKRQTLELPQRKAAIQREYDGHNARHLARKYGLTVRRVQSIVKGK
jgi:Mor family transcriptional regulator